MDLPPKSLTKVKELYPLIRLARDQGWHLRKLSNNHLRWIPPKGPIVQTSCTPHSNQAVHKMIADLKRSGLRIGDDYESMKIKELLVKDETCTEPEEATPPPAPIAPTPAPDKRSLPAAERRSGVMEAIYALFQEHPNSDMGVPLVCERLQSKFPGIKSSDLYAPMSTLSNRRLIMPAGKRGFYKLDSTTPVTVAMGRPVIQAIVAPPEEAKAMEEDDQIIEEFLAAVMKMEDWIRKMKRRSAQFYKLKKMLDGVDIE